MGRKGYEIIGSVNSSAKSEKEDKVRRTISLHDEQLIAFATAETRKNHEGNFSRYVRSLILEHKQQQVRRRKAAA